VAFAVFAPAAGAVTSRQTAAVTLTTTQPGVAAGSTQRIHIRNPDDPTAKPFTIQTIVFRLAPGSVIDTGALPQCKASDAELMAQGGSACPASTRVNTGLVRSDTGSTAIFPRFVNSDIQNFNNQDELIGVADTREIPNRNVTHSRISGNSITFNVPDAPGMGPPDNFSALTDLTIVTPALARGGRAYTRTPPTCPTSGFWSGSILFIYKDGVRQTVDTTAPCKGSGPNRRLDRTRPRIRLRGVPSRRRCARASFPARVRVSDRSGLRRIAVYLDGRLIRSTRKTGFRVRVRTRRGHHRLTVLARDGAGNRARLSRVFRRCAG
jgi:hypothetical protein